MEPELRKKPRFYFGSACFTDQSATLVKDAPMHAEI